ncbi:MAG: hypothetical protein IT449_00745 [Phycisphaerales bacterium]|nr:hypothetical protein [Phycisphaerales bacterium]
MKSSFWGNRVDVEAGAARGMGRRLNAALVLALVTVLGATALPARAEEKSYRGHEVLHVQVENVVQLETLLALEAAEEDISIWSEGAGVGEVDVCVSPMQKSALDQAGFAYDVWINDVGALIEAERSPLAGNEFFEAFRTYQEYASFLNSLASRFPSLAQVVRVGGSWEGRDLLAIRITGAGGGSKPGVFYIGCQHAREWLTPPIMAYTAEHLLENYGHDPAVTAMVDGLEWYILPISNPDGYVYTWNQDRMWRKNRRNNGSGSYGVDLNRNWAVGFGGEGSSGSRNGETYRGPSAFSEPETAAIRDFLLARPNIQAFLDIHSYGQMMLWPWGHTPSLPPDDDDLRYLGEVMVEQIYAVNGKRYGRVGNIYDTIYPAAGNSVDYTYGDRGAWSLAFEVRGMGFSVPPAEILPAARENMAAMKYLSAWLLRGGPIRCEDVVKFQAKCGGDSGVTAKAVLTDSSRSGDYIPFLYPSGKRYALINGKTAKFWECCFNTGQDMELAFPVNCKPPRTLDCP